MDNEFERRIQRCSIEGCEAKRRGLGFCNKHYKRLLKTGTTSARTVEGRFWSKVDKSGECWLWTAFRDRGGYGSFNLEGKIRKSHRVAYELVNGPIPGGLALDHTCHNPACVNPDHLRPVTTKQNLENRSGPRKGTSSGIRGVTWHKQTRKWAAQVRHCGRTNHVGLFDKLEEAEAAVIAKRLELFTHNDVDRSSAA